ncbi:MAG: GH116 family glycosyl hydrolase [Candidatus Omnitrophota bacterium]
MPLYNSKQKIKSGVPLGGIGAGKSEITPYGTIDYITYQNNWTRPIANKDNKEKGKAQGVTGFHFGLYVNTQPAVICKLLQTEKVEGYNTVKQINYRGFFPLAQLAFDAGNLPVEILLTAYSVFIPGDLKHSSLPAAVFEFELKNKVHKEIEAGIICMGRNLISNNSVGRYNVVRREKGITGINFLHKKPLAHDTRAGDVFVGVGCGSGEISYLGQWNMQTENFYFEPKVKLAALEYFEKDASLPNLNQKSPSLSQSVELGGAVAVKFKLKPNQRKKALFVHSWYFPKNYPGHFYEKNFRNSVDVAVYVNKHRDYLKEESLKLPNILDEMGLEDWLKDALMNNLYPLISSSWLTKSGDFTMYEAPLICPLMGTLDVYFYASVALGLLFPSLDKKALLLFKKNIRKDGYVPHDIGYERMDLPSNGTTMPLWKDLNSKFILLGYRAYHDSGDLAFLKEMYPALKKALEWSLSLDKDGDGLPENEGFDTTFDTWDFKGASSYNSSIFLASLLALKNIAELLKDKKTAKKCIRHFVKGRESFDEKLWNGKYYITARSKNEAYESCMVAQLAGQWYAYLVGLGRIFSPGNIQSSIKWIFKLNGKDSPFGATNSVFENRKRDERTYHSKNIWPGVCYSFAALAIYEGFVKEGLQLTKKVWNTIAVKNKNPWNQPDVIISKDGSFGFGDYYMRNSVIWAVLLALAAKEKRVEYGIRKIRAWVRAAKS